MLLLLAIGFVAGVVTALSPCVLPVLPIVLAGGATVFTEEEFGLTPSPDWLQELHLQALLVPMEQ